MKKILVIDDDVAISDLIRISLTREGFEVIVDNRGENAEKMVAIHKPDLIILDVLLPGINGFDLCRNLRKTSEIPVIFLT